MKTSQNITYMPYDMKADNMSQQYIDSAEAMMKRHEEEAKIVYEALKAIQKDQREFNKKTN